MPATNIKFFFQGEMQNVLKKITMPIVPKEDCQKALRDTRLGKYFLLHDSFMCAGGEGVDTCVVSSLYFISKPIY